MKPLYSYFGGKQTVVNDVWNRLGKVEIYAEPFFGGGAVLLGRPGGAHGLEIINDANGYLVNFWRALQKDPEGVLRHCKSPTFETDLHARHLWLNSVADKLKFNLLKDPTWYSTKAAGWWFWGHTINVSKVNWCSGRGSWVLGDKGLQKKKDGERGINLSRPLVEPPLIDMHKLQAAHRRIRNVRILCGDFMRCLDVSPSQYANSVTGIFLDPPYDTAEAQEAGNELYAVTNKVPAAIRSRKWALENGNRKNYRIVLCGYREEHDKEMMDAGWSRMNWVSRGHPVKNNTNRFREAIWFSPHCLKVKSLF